MPEAERQKVEGQPRRKSDRNRLLAAIHARLKELISLGQMTDGDYRALLKREFGVESSADLDQGDLVSLLRMLKGEPESIYHRRRRYWNRQGAGPSMATAEQLAIVEELWERVSRAADKSHSLRQFLFKRFKVSDLRFLDAEVAAKAINALRAMARRR